MVKEAKTIGITGHVRPDGDCIGASLALYLYLQKNLPEVRVDVFLDTPPPFFACLQGFEAIINDGKSDIKEYDIFFALDAPQNRLGKAENLFKKAKTRINIDHHVSNDGDGDINIMQPEAAATCELLYSLLDFPDELDADIAKAIYIGIAHDTGVFRYGSMTPKTFEIIAALMKYDFDFAQILNDTYFERTYVQHQILGRALLESIVFMDGRCIVSCLSRRTLDFYHVGSGDFEGIVNRLLATKGVECAIFMYQTRGHEYKVSLRSQGVVDVAEIAGCFGGGGHVRAAGVTMKGTFHDVVNIISSRIEAQLDSRKNVG
jgi:phosphoesterase RecJ-like protein